MTASFSVSRRTSCVALLALSSAHTSFGAEYPWPEIVVGVELMRPIQPLTLQVPRSRPRGELRGPVVLKVHVDSAGLVQRAILFESSGSPGHDEAAVLAVRAAQFMPLVRDGRPVDVTLILPMHLPMPRNRQPPS